MNKNLSEEYKNWIEKLSKDSFDELVLNFAKEYYETKDIFLSDGPWDGGIDLTIIKNGKTIKRNIQITTQKTGLEKKLWDDLKKSKENVNEYEYLNKLDFYTSNSISRSKKDKLIKQAYLDFEIDLKFFDANELGGLANEYKSIREIIYKINKAAFPEEKLDIDEKTRILFDTLSMSQDFTFLKKNFIHALIISYLYQVKQASVEKIFNELKNVFFQSYDKVFFENEIGKLKSQNKIIDISETRPKLFKLTEEVKNNLKQIDENSQMLEKDLINQFKSILERYKLENKTKDIASFIIELYNANYEIDINEILNQTNNHTKKIQGIFNRLIKYLEKYPGINTKISNDIARQLLIVCENNQFLNKTSVSKMFISLFKSDKLEQYLNQNKRIVYLDTQILLQLICFSFENIEYENQLYKIVKHFYNIIEKSKIPICLHTTSGYVEEVAWHVVNGIKLERFLELNFIKDLGPSKNVFFNYYLAIKDLPDTNINSFLEFVEELFDVDATNYNRRDFTSDLIISLVERFRLLNIQVETPPIFENYNKYKRQYEISLSYLKHDQKTYDARKHDLNTILYLSEIHFDLKEGYFTEPFLITWDNSFYKVREDFKKFIELNHWYLYPPMKFANTISVLNMQIDSTAINYNIISLVEDNFNTSNDTISFLDLINNLFQGTDAKKWKLASNLAKLRKQLINESKLEDFNLTKGKNIPIDEMLLLIQKFYQDPQNKRNYNNLVTLFQNNIFADRLSRLFEANIKDFQHNNKIKQSIINELDEMIKENNEAQQ